MRKGIRKEPHTVLIFDVCKSNMQSFDNKTLTTA